MLDGRGLATRGTGTPAPHLCERNEGHACGENDSASNTVKAVIDWAKGWGGGWRGKERDIPECASSPLSVSGVCLCLCASVMFHCLPSSIASYSALSRR